MYVIVWYIRAIDYAIVVHTYIYYDSVSQCRNLKSFLAPFDEEIATSLSETTRCRRHPSQPITADTGPSSELSSSARGPREQKTKDCEQLDQSTTSADNGIAQCQGARRRCHAGRDMRTGRGEYTATRASRFSIYLACRRSPHPSKLSASSIICGSSCP